MTRITMVLWVVTGALAAQGQSQPPALLIQRAIQQMQLNMGRQPNYTCLETVDRTRRLPDVKDVIEDTLRLEVALVDGKEMFAWPGEKQFEDREIKDLIRNGMFGNGNYGIYTRMLFGGDAPPYEYVATPEIQGRPAAQFRYGVPKDSSGYSLSVNQLTERVGFHGFVYVDPVTADILRIELIADDIPGPLGLTATESSVDFGRVRIAQDSEPFLLPVESSLMMASRDTSLSRNRVRFSGCHKFVGESTFILDDSELLQAAVVIEETRLPAAVEMDLEFRDSLPLASAAVGDAITAELKSEIKDGKRVLVPKGAKAKGRILMLERSPNRTRVQLRFYELTWPGHHASFTADFLRWVGFLPVSQKTASRQGDSLVFPGTVPPDLKGDRWTFQTLP